MKFFKNSNILRRKLMHGITKNVGKSGFENPIDLSIPIQIKRVLICRPNQRLGNLLLITPLLQEVIRAFPDSKVDLFVKGGLAPILFSNYPNVDSIIQLPSKPFKQKWKYLQAWSRIRKQHYDLVINVDSNSSSGRLATQFAHSRFRIYGDADPDMQCKYKDYLHIAKNPVYHFRDFLSRLGFANKDSPIPTLDLRLTASELAEGKKILDDLIGNEKKTISIFTFATGTKIYSESWWAAFYQRLKQEYPNHNIIEVLPMENVSQLGFEAPSFYSKDIRMIGALIANTEVFVGADSGIMHLAVAAQATIVGLFGGPYMTKYLPYGNHSVGINTGNSNIEDWIRVLEGIIVRD